jgi:hypothetical protein
MDVSVSRLRQALALVAGLSLLLAGPLPARDFFLQEGTEVILRLHTTVDTEISQKGDRILCTVSTPIQIDNIEVIPEGSRVLGRVGDIKRPGRFGRKGQMVLSFDSIEVPGAGNVKISGSLVDIYDPEYEDHVTDQEMDELKGVSLGREGEVKGAGPSRLKQGLSMGGGRGRRRGLRLVQGKARGTAGRDGPDYAHRPRPDAERARHATTRRQRKVDLTPAYDPGFPFTLKRFSSSAKPPTRR